MNRLLHLWNVLVRDPAENAVVWVRILIILFFLNTVAKWLFNICEVPAGTITLAVIGLLAIVLSALSLRLLAIFGAGGGVNAWLKSTKEQKRDLTEGVLKGLGLEYRIVVAFAMCDVFSSIVLIVRDFSQNPGSFWVFYLAITLTFLAKVVWYIRSRWTPYLVILFGIIVMIGAIWQSPGGAYTGQAFDSDTGEPLIMVDPFTRMQDVLKRTGDKCRKTKLVTQVNELGLEEQVRIVVPHKGYNYAEEGTCPSPESGLPLVPLTAEEAAKRSRPVRALGKSAKMVIGQALESVKKRFVGESDPNKVRWESCPSDSQFSSFQNCKTVTLKAGQFARYEKPMEGCSVPIYDRNMTKSGGGTKTISLLPGHKEGSAIRIVMHEGQVAELYGKTYKCHKRKAREVINMSGAMSGA